MIYPAGKNNSVINSQITFFRFVWPWCETTSSLSHTKLKLSPIHQANKKYLRMGRCCPRKCLFHLQECLLGGRLWIPGSTFQRDDDIFIQQTYRLVSLSRPFLRYIPLGLLFEPCFVSSHFFNLTIWILRDWSLFTGWGRLQNGTITDPKPTPTPIS